tara:strand:+ start:38 stop:403 length:366 start_codon:yes stop_codon:yes gene_type:complete
MYMPFTHDDFKGDNITRLSVVCMPKIGKKPLFPYKSLMQHEQKKFNKVMNEYIQSLGENWLPKLIEDFNTITNDEIFNEQFDPKTYDVIDTRMGYTNIPKDAQTDEILELPPKGLVFDERA